MRLFKITGNLSFLHFINLTGFKLKMIDKVLFLLIARKNSSYHLGKSRICEILR